MKKIAIAAAMLVLLGFAGVSHASDWDLVGKVLTGIEGARILTGGKVDVIGGVMDITGIGDGSREKIVREEKIIVVERQAPRSRVWVPEYRWEDVWVPGHTVRDPRYGNVYIEGHYVQYKVECGGHWEYASGRGRDVCSGRTGRR